MFARRDEAPKFQYNGRSAACADRSWQSRQGEHTMATLRIRTVVSQIFRAARAGAFRSPLQAAAPFALLACMSSANAQVSSTAAGPTNEEVQEVTVRSEEHTSELQS